MLTETPSYSSPNAISYGSLMSMKLESVGNVFIFVAGLVVLFLGSLFFPLPGILRIVWSLVTGGSICFLAIERVVNKSPRHYKE